MDLRKLSANWILFIQRTPLGSLILETAPCGCYFEIVRQWTVCSEFTLVLDNFVNGEY